MDRRLFWSGPDCRFCVVPATPARADSLHTAVTEIIVGIVVVSAAIAVTATVLIIHYKPKKIAITGCVNSGPQGMSITDEKDNRNYTISGSASGLKTGERMALDGRAKKTGHTMIFEPHRVIKDFGPCQP